MSLYTQNNRLIRSENRLENIKGWSIRLEYRIKNIKGAEHLIENRIKKYKMGGALPVKYSEYFGAKRRESLKNENIRYDILIKYSH